MPKRQAFCLPSGKWGLITPLKKQTIDSIVKLKTSLGKGGYGQVWLGQKPNSPKQIAVKTIKTNTIAGHDDVLREIWYLLQTKGNPYICQIKKAYQKTVAKCKTSYILMELYELNFHDYLRDAKRDHRCDFYLAVNQLSKGLETIHSLGIVHRDFTLANIFVKFLPEEEEPYRLVIGDFGMARQFPPTYFQSYLPATKQPELLTVDSETDSVTTTVTTVLFRAPEVLLGSTTYTWPVDCWAFGIILYYVSKGKNAFAIRKREGKANFDLWENKIWPKFNTPLCNPRNLPMCYFPNELADLASVTAPEEILQSLPAEHAKPIAALLRLCPASRMNMVEFRQKFTSFQS